ncbi:MAG: hypothetical protein OH337_03670 [Candidatus Parvarchaeota archaeon]|nr:hypothetical protein [Candidatus Haiyanarchaeum thermophilum]
MDISKEITEFVAYLCEVNNVLSRRIGYEKTVAELRKTVVQLQKLLDTYEKEHRALTEYVKTLEIFFRG